MTYDPPGVPLMSREDYLAAIDRCYPPALAKLFKPPDDLARVLWSYGSGPNTLAGDEDL